VFYASQGKRDIPKHRYMTDMMTKRNNELQCVVARRLDWDMVDREIFKKERGAESALCGGGEVCW
jgi:hypothetical protein